MSVSIYKGQCVVVFGTASLQRYIFQSNRLKENVGASYLAKCCFEENLVEAVKEAGYTIITEDWEKYEKHAWNENNDLPPTIQPETGKAVTVIYIGGGNAAMLCKDRTIANKVVRTWSRGLIENAPGLRVTVGYGEVKDSLAQAYREALYGKTESTSEQAYYEASNDLVSCEEALPFGSALGSLPVVRTCISTGFPASKRSGEPDERNQWISRVTDCKRKAAENAITAELKTVLKNGQRFPIDLDKLGGSEGQSYIAVVHADGDGMGKRRNEVIDARQNDAEFLHNLRAFSASVSSQSLKALRATLVHLQEALPRLKTDLSVDTLKILPIRPIVYGGDDLTFVCDGRLGLNLAALYLQEFSKRKIRVLDGWESMSACAGVAIVPRKFPFAQAYNFADDLCKAAKKRRRDGDRERSWSDKDPSSWLDFHLIQEGATKSITALRDEQYRSLEGARLHKRPYQVTIGNDDSVEIFEDFQWDNFVEILKIFQSSEWPRNRAKGLLQTLTQGANATQRFVVFTKSGGVELPPSKESSTGWSGGDRRDRTTPYFDPLEVLDFYLEVKSTTE